MCGLVGIYGIGLDDKDSSAFNLLLHVDTIRGAHSTGVLTVNKDGATNLFKQVGPPEELYKKFPQVFVKGKLLVNNNQLLMGHNRYATQGLHTAENAHPFDMGTIVGMHNGTVNQYSIKDLDGYKDYHIDSQIIMKHLSGHPVDEVWKVANGPMTLIWWDKEKQELNWARNKDRPLFYSITADKKKLYWASEHWMIWAAAHRNGVKLGKIMDTQVDQHYTIKFVNDEVKVSKRALTPFVPPKITYHTTTSSPTFKSTGEHVNFTLYEWVPYTNAVGGYFKGYTVKDFKEVRVYCAKVEPRITNMIEGLANQKSDDIYSTYAAYPLHLDTGTGWTMSAVNVFKTNLSTVKKKNKKFSEKMDWLYGLDDKEDNKSVLASLKKEVAYDFYGAKIDYFEFKDLTKDGCHACKAPITWDERNEIGWHSYNSAFCPSCEDTNYIERTNKQIKSLPIITVPYVEKAYVTNNRVVDKEEWNKIVSCGCYNCKATPTWEQRGVLKWWYEGIDEKFLCTACVQH